MPLPSFFKRQPADSRNLPEDPLGVDAARTRARRRLIGAVVLLAAGVIGFPLVFETQPRPVATDIPIETPRRETPAAPAAPPTRSVHAKVPAPVVTEPPAEIAASAPSEPATVVAKAEPKPEPKPEPPKPEPKPEPKAEPKPDKQAKADEAQRAKALLDGAAAPASQAKAARYVVQVGAYTDNADVREARAKVEKLGMSSYTQVIETDGAKRTRVRVGPFETREEADKVSARLKATGLPVHVFKL